MKTLDEKQEVVLDDPVNHPSHYTSGKIEVIDFIEDQKMPYHLGNACKYLGKGCEELLREADQQMKENIEYERTNPHWFSPSKEEDEA